MMKGYKSNITTTAGIFAFVLCSGFFVGFSEAGREIRDALSGEEMAEAAGYGMEKLSTVLVTGSVACDACLAGNIATHPHPVSGAVVGVACRTGHRRRAVRAKGVTDRYGDFIIDLPSDLHADPYLDRKCVVRIQRLPRKSLCHATFVKRNKAIELASVGNGIREYTAGKIRLHNLKHIEAQTCSKTTTNGKQM
uniref:Pollen Ole e 1 allergen and extensin family protein n=1 Tax=Kalanchoe fedtschenkoi TaxID=63787 RepID=A0A7N1A1I0_KALFE